MAHRKFQKPTSPLLMSQTDSEKMDAIGRNIKEEKDDTRPGDMSEALVNIGDLKVKVEQNSESQEKNDRGTQDENVLEMNIKEEKDDTRPGDMSEALVNIGDLKVKVEQNSESQEKNYGGTQDGNVLEMNIKEEKDYTRPGDMSEALVNIGDLKVKVEQNSESQEKNDRGTKDGNLLEINIKNEKDDDSEDDDGLPVFMDLYDQPIDDATFLNIEDEEDGAGQKDEESSDDEFVSIGGLPLFKDLHDQLYDHQRAGAAFLYSLYRYGHKGGVLADDMGLGKTIQVTAFLSGMYDAGLVKHTLIVMPLSLIPTWTNELAKWTPGIRVKEFRCETKAERDRNLEKIQRQGGVLLTTYHVMMSSWEQLGSYNGRKFKWDYIILDEAHKIKNTSTKTAKSAYAIPAENRILLTGTPVQNNLREMWALFDFARQGTLLGTYRTFKKMYERPIIRGRQKDATSKEKALGLRMSQNLITIIKPYFLRRTKEEVQINLKKERLHSSDSQVTNTQTATGTAVMPTMTRKNDLIVWTYLSAVQEDIYHQFVSLDFVQELLNSKRSPLTALIVLKKLCDHPRLLSARAISQMDLKELTSKNQLDVDDEYGSSSIDHIADETLISESGKMVFLIQLLEQLREEGHRTLIFAGFLKVLDIIEQVLGNKGFKVLRLDGKIGKTAERERLISLFQEDRSYSVFLLTTQVGGVGITLTGADRVVIFDPSWNPATDAQAVDRVYRIGQTENVVIYRLITCGTVEEKIYRRQVFKDSLTRQSTGDKKNPFRYFSKQELRELFILEDPRSSNTQMLLQSLHAKHRRTDPKLDQHITHLHSMEIFGVSDHDLMFSQEDDHDDGPDDKKSLRYIEDKVQMAQQMMKAESQMHAQQGSSVEHDWLRQLDHNSRDSPWPNKKSGKRWSLPSPPAPEYQNDTRDSPPALGVKLEQPGYVKEEHDYCQSKSMQVIDHCQRQSRQLIDLTWDEDVPAWSEPVEKPKRKRRKRQSLQVIDLTLERGVGENQAVDPDEGVTEHDSPSSASFWSEPVVKPNYKRRQNQSMQVMDLTLEKSVGEKQAVDPDEGVTENQTVNLDEDVTAVNPDEGVTAVNPDEGVTAVNPDEGVTAVNPDEGVTAVNPDEGLTENQAVDLNEDVTENQAVDLNEDVTENQAVDRDDGVTENQGQAVDLDVDEGVVENPKKRKAAVLHESEEDDHMPSSNLFDHSSPSSPYYAVLSPHWSTPIRSRAPDSLELLRASTQSFFETWKCEELNNNEEYGGVEQYSD